MKPLLIIKAGSTFPEMARQHGDFEAWVLSGMRLAAKRAAIVPVCHGAQLAPPETFCAAVITGSHAMVTDGDPWIAATIEWLRQACAVNLPILGICFGHQMLAAALGGQADWNPLGREIGTRVVTLTDEGRRDPLFRNLPISFPAHLTHRQSAVRLPPRARLLAASLGDPHQAFTVGSAYGVQFHPEFTETAMRGYIDILADELRGEGFDPEALRLDIQPTPTATSLLARFCQMAKETGAGQFT